jgi:hypothetical protein
MNRFGWFGRFPGFALGIVGKEGSTVFILAIRSGNGTSRWIWIFGVGIQIICCFDFGFGDVAITAC